MTTRPADLPSVPHLVDRDPEVVEREIVQRYEALVGRPLRPAHVDRLLLQALAYRETLVRTQMQYVAEQNLVAFATWPMLDFLGELVGVARLDAAPAKTEIRFVLAAPQPGPVIIPSGTLIESAGGTAFATTSPLVLAAGEVNGTVAAAAVEAGAAGNGFAPGTINVLVRPLMHVSAASNLTVTSGGADVESDERLRRRIREAPHAFSVAGSVGAYRAHALTAHQDVADVAVESPAPGRVRLAVLAVGGEPTDAVLAAVEAATSAETVRPLTDSVEVVAATRIPYVLTATVTFDLGADPAVTFASLQSAVAGYVESRRAALGRDVIPSQVVASMSVSGVRRVVLAEPAEITVGPGEWADCEAVVINVAATDV